MGIKFLKSNLYLILTTSQSPHLEAAFHYADQVRDDFEEVIVIDAITGSRYRHEYTWRSYHPIRLNLSRKIRNGIFKKYFLKKNLDHYKVHRLMDYQQDNPFISGEDIYKILKTYSSTEYRTPSIIESKYSKKIIEEIKIKSASIKNLIEENDIQKDSHFLIFNGRLPSEFSIVHTLKLFGFSNIIYHECNNYQNKVYYTPFSPHNLESFSSLIKDYALKNPDSELRWRNFNDIKLSKIPLNIKRSIITYFTSSSDEYQFYYNPPINQSKIILSLIDLARKGLPIKIRVHPNTSNKSKKSRLYWDRLKEIYPNIIINYDELDLSSFDYILRSIFTISIGSSVAPESILLNAPHLLIGGQSYYSNLPGYIKADEANFVELITDLFQNQSKLCRFSNLEDRLYAASSILFEREIGFRIAVAPFGSYPTPDSLT